MTSADHYEANRDQMDAVMLLGLRQIPHLDRVLEAIKDGVCCMNGDIIDPETGFV